MSKYPFIKFTICFIVGIVINHLVNPELVYLLPTLIILFVLTGLSVLVPSVKLLPVSFRQVMLYLLIIMSAILFSRINTGDEAIYPFNHQRLKDIEVIGDVADRELPGVKYNDFCLNVNRFIKNNDTVNVNLKLLCKLKTGSGRAVTKFNIGDIVSASGTLLKAREQRNPYEFDYNNYLNTNGIAGLFYIKDIKDISVIDSAESDLLQIIYSARLSVSGLIDRLYSEKTAALIKGLLLADRSGIDYDTRETFVNSGVIHVLAVSGLHVGYIALIFLFLLSRTNVYYKNIGTIVGLFLFVLITGAPTSVVRASIMATVLILSNLSIRKYNSFNSLAIAAFIVLIIDPAELFNPGFQLSFSAVLSIFIIYPIISNYINSAEITSKTFKAVLLFIGVSLAAQLGTLPFTLYYFNKLSIAALAVNLMVIPIIGVIVSLGITSLVFGSLWFYVGSCYAFTNELFSELLFTIVEFTGTKTYSYLYIPEFSLFDGIIFYILLSITLYAVTKFRSYKAKIAVIILVAANSFALYPLDNSKLLPDSLLSVVMVDIGQGDSFLIKFPNNQTALVDAGNASFGFDNGERVIYPLLRNLGIERIDYAFISHMDADHYKGFESLVEHEIIDTIYKPFCDSSVTHDIEFEELANEYGIPVHYYDNNVFRIGGARIYVLNDLIHDREAGYSMNDRSGVMKLVYGSTSVLFTGDAGKSVEKDLIHTYATFLESDVLKAGHHGSKTSTSREFLSAVSPDKVFISAGLFNKFNHPAKSVVNSFKSENIEIFRTDLQRAVVLQSDGYKFRQIKWFK